MQEPFYQKGSCKSRSLSAVLHSALDFAVGIVFGDGVALIVQLFTAAEADLDLYARAGKIEREGNQGKSFLRRQTVELQDLLFMHKETATAQGVAIKDISMLIGAYMHTDNEDFAILNVDIGIFKVDAACADAFDLCTEKLDARLIFFVHEIIVICLFILRNYFIAAFFISQNGHLLFFIRPILRA